LLPANFFVVILKHSPIKTLVGIGKEDESREESEKAEEQKFTEGFLK